MGTGKAHIVAVTGGIGSGKSVVCKVLETMGFPVYDCDKEARKIMDSSHEIHNELNEKIHPDIVKESHINRDLLSSIVFSEPEKLTALNEIVHSSVRESFSKFCESHRIKDIVFVETAILYQSKMDSMVDEVWTVIAPEEIRIRRVGARNGLSPEKVKKRIISQQAEDRCVHYNSHTIVNDNSTPVLPQIENLLRKNNIDV